MKEKVKYCREKALESFCPERIPAIVDKATFLVELFFFVAYRPRTPVWFLSSLPKTFSSLVFPNTNVTAAPQHLCRTGGGLRSLSTSLWRATIQFIFSTRHSLLSTPSPAMAGVANLRPLLAGRVSRQLLQPARRAFTTSRPSQNLLANRRPAAPSTLHRPTLSQSFRRAYADGNPVDPALKNKAPKKKRFRFLRWTWRLTYLSAIAGSIYIGVGIYEAKHPDDQPEPDPKKKTLVVLGMSPIACLSEHNFWPSWQDFNDCVLTLLASRNWLGLRVTLEKARH